MVKPGQRGHGTQAKATDLQAAQEEIKSKKPRLAMNRLEPLARCPERDFLLAKALVKCVCQAREDPDSLAARAKDLLAPLLFPDEHQEAPSDRRAEIVRLLVEAAKWSDPHLADLIKGEADPPKGSRKARDVLRAFYFQGAQPGQSMGERAFSAKDALRRALRPQRTFLEEDFFIEFLKSYSSYGPLLPSLSREGTGGGYFAALGGTGCVIDPGHHFLDNFFHEGRSVRDVDCIFVTHFHDDHFADLPALLSLLHHWHEEGRSYGVRLFADGQTMRMFEPIIRASRYIKDRKQLKPGRTWKELNDCVSFRALPTRHDVWGTMESGVGLAFRIQRSHTSYLLITGDTGWDDAVEAAYAEFRGHDTTLVAHLSSVAREDVMAALDSGGQHFYGSHLCVHGVCRAIEVVRPRRVILSEVGQELNDVVDALAKIIGHVYGIDCYVCRVGLHCYP